MRHLTRRKDQGLKETRDSSSLLRLATQKRGSKRSLGGAQICSSSTGWSCIRRRTLKFMTQIRYLGSLTLGKWNLTSSSCSGQLGAKRKPTDTKREAPQLSGTMIRSFWLPLQTALASSMSWSPTTRISRLQALRRYSKRQPKRITRCSSNPWLLQKQGSQLCMRLSRLLSTSKIWSRISRVSGRKKVSPPWRTVLWCILSKIRSE